MWLSQTKKPGQNLDQTKNVKIINQNNLFRTENILYAYSAKIDFPFYSFRMYVQAGKWEKYEKPGYSSKFIV